MKANSTLCLGLLLFGAVLTQFTSAKSSMALSAQEPVEEASPLVIAMELLHDNERVMKKALKDEGDFPKALEAVVGMQAGAHAAKLLTPPRIETIPEAKRAEFMKGFRQQMIAMSQDLLTLENLLLEGELEQARAMFQKVRDHEGTGHDRYAE